MSGSLLFVIKILLKLFYFLSKLFFLTFGGTLLIFVQHSLIHSHNFFVYCGEVLDGVLFCVWATKAKTIVFGRFGWPLEGPVLVRFVRANPLI